MEWDGDEGVNGGDAIETLGRKIELDHVDLDKAGLRDVLSRERDLVGRNSRHRELAGPPSALRLVVCLPGMTVLQ